MTYATSQTGGFGGGFSGHIQGTATDLRLETAGNEFKGTANAGGYIYELSGTIQNNRGTGQLRDPQNGASMGFEMTLQGDTLILSIAFPDLYTGGVNNVSLQFQRRKAGGVEGVTTGPSQLDPVLMGEWMRSQSMSGDGIAVVTQERLRMNPDGSFLMYDSKAAGPMGTMQGSESLAGQWRTEQGIIYVLVPGQSSWMPYGRYIVQGASLMFTLADGSRELWSRQA